MNTPKHTLSVDVAGKTLSFETGHIARQANGSVILRCNDTVIMSTACQSKEALPDVDFLPLRVDYQEKFSSAGKTLGGFIKREGKPTEKEVLISRLIDRPIRPMFEDGYYHDVQLLAYVMSYDNSAMPEPLAICAVSAALLISDIPLKKAIAAVCVARIDGNWVINPTKEEQDKSELELMIAGTKDAILMIEGYCDFLTEDQIMDAIEAGHEAIADICIKLEKWKEEIGKTNIAFTPVLASQELMQAIRDEHGEALQQAVTTKDKLQREQMLSEVHKKVVKRYLDCDEPTYSKPVVMFSLKKVQSGMMRDRILSTKERTDGRKLDEIRPIQITPKFLPRTHGSAVFTRGETQAVAVCTLGGESMGQRYEDLEGDYTRRFYLQYSFPPFSVGEVGRMGPPGRREVGHGKLAEKALMAIVPSTDTFPYTLRLESNITESNGSSSMASVCGGCLAMMDAGVPITKPIAGIAMGLILENSDYVILSDILGIEDALGDMDFKITGNHEGITAFQLDIKVEGITRDIMSDALKQAKAGREHILDKMLEVCPTHAEDLSEHAPRIEQIKVPLNKIGVIIGPGGKQIKAIIAETGVDIDISEEADYGVVNVSSSDGKAMQQAKDIVHNLIAEVEIDKTYEGKVVSIVPFGMFVQILNKEGLCHISEIDHKRVENVEDYYKEGDTVEVKVIDVNDRGQIKLSRKALIPKGDGSTQPSSSGSSRPKEPRKNHDKKEPRKKIDVLPPPPTIKNS